MFEHFTFAAQAQPTDQQEEMISTSPTDISFPSPASATRQSSLPPWSPYQQDTVDGIIHKFSQQSLRREDEELPQPSVWQGRDDALPSPDFDMDDEFTPEELSYTSTTRGMITVPVPTYTQSLPSLPSLPCPQGGTIACRRLQRQLNVQLQASSSHIRDINALVDHMIVTNSQCTLHKSTSRSYLSSPPPSRAGREDLVVDTTGYRFQGRNIPDEDEGFSEIADEDWGIEEEMTLRRASTPSGIRKYGVMRWRGSAECVAAINAAGRTNVRSVPRMRRRKPKSVPE
ncbi:hypothetical protein F5882DRAFT_388511 [Hyaloscypha sp. PMI_1271]|jgi:hypothetical protein|nr:hypothetical protein F5882DRAFT_388511 [Hyaloscypha sp. PMI_1271]